MPSGLVLAGLAGGIFGVPLAFWPFAHQPDETAKWFLVYGVSFLLALFLALAKGRNPKERSVSPDQREILWLCVLALTYICAIFLYWRRGFTGVFLDWSAFMAIAWATTVVTQTRPNWYALLRRALYLAGGICLALSISQWLGFNPLAEGQGAMRFPSGTWLSQNFYGEFLGALAIFQLFDLLRARARRRLILSGFFAATFCVLLLQFSRSAILALVVAALWLIYFEPKAKKWRKTFALGFLVFLACIGLGLSVFSAARPDLAKVKSDNLHKRLARWSNTWEMAKDHPWGVGPGKYPYAYLSYRAAKRADAEVNPQNIALSPHNGYLEYLVENGWLAALALGLYLTRLLVSGWRRRARSLKSRGFRVLLVYFLVDALASFPMEVSFPFFLAAILLGFWLAQAKRERGIPREDWPLYFRFAPRLVLPVLTLWIGLAGGAWGYAQFVFSYRANDPVALERACALFPDFWQNCFAAAQLQEARGNERAALVTLGTMLKREENLFPAIRLVAVTAFGTGNQKLGCAAVGRYEKLFPEVAADGRWAELGRACADLP